MKIYTYFESLGDSSSEQKELLKLWEKSWEKQGFEPIVLGRKDAQNHSFFDVFVKELESIHISLMSGCDKKENIEAYGLSCYLRWLAYSSQPNESFYVSDYDVINTGFQPLDPIQPLHLMHNVCPCFASGTPIQFYNLCKLFIDLTKNNLKNISDKAKQFRWYHDQNFFVCNKNYIGQDYDIKFSMLDDWNKTIHHVSHEYIYNKFDTHKNLHENRIKVINDLINS